MNHYNLHIKVVTELNQSWFGRKIKVSQGKPFDTGYMFGLPGKVLEWLRSCLEQHSQRVSVHGIVYDVQFLSAGVEEFRTLCY